VNIKHFRSLVILLLLLNLGCGVAYSLTPTKIKDILDHPRDFEGKDITLSGTVTNSVSLLLIKYYEIQDGTGSIKIVTDKLLPSRGEKLAVTGRMMVIELGTERWVVIRENQNYPDQNIGSGKPDYLTDNNQTGY
jgi:hypothetical protein